MFDIRGQTQNVIKACDMVSGSRRCRYEIASYLLLSVVVCGCGSAFAYGCPSLAFLVLDESSVHESLVPQSDHSDVQKDEVDIGQTDVDDGLEKSEVEVSRVGRCSAEAPLLSAATTREPHFDAAIRRDKTISRCSFKYNLASHEALKKIQPSEIIQRRCPPHILDPPTLATMAPSAIIPKEIHDLPVVTKSAQIDHRNSQAQQRETKKSALELISQGQTLPGIPTHVSFHEHRQWILSKMALAFRIFARKGYTEGMSGHISVRDPENPHTFWTNPLSKHFGLLKASDMILVNYDGQAIGGNRSLPANAAGFLIHSAVHKARPDVAAACHTHSVYGKAWSAFARPLEMLNQDVTYFYGDAQAVYKVSGEKCHFWHARDADAVTGLQRRGVLGRGRQALGRCIGTERQRHDSPEPWLADHRHDCR